MSSATDTVERLRQKHTELKERQAALTLEYRSLTAIPENAGKIDRLRDAIRKNVVDQRENNGHLAVAKEARRRERLQELLTSPEYHQALQTALESAAATLGPWAKVVRLESEARRVNSPIPFLPPSIGSFVIELRCWLRPLAALGAIDLKRLPEPLAELMEGSPR